MTPKPIPTTATATAPSRPAARPRFAPRFTCFGNRGRNSRGMWLIARRSLRHHALSTVVTVLSVALAAGLVMAVASIERQSRDAFLGGNIGFDGVLGARGSELQLVLNTVYHLETSPGNIPWSRYQRIKADPRISLAIPYALGDNYFGYRIVGTTSDLFTTYKFRDDTKYRVRPGGRFFDDMRREAIVGHVVAQHLNLDIGDVFQPFCGLDFDPGKQHTEEYVIVGVLEPTNSPNDRVIWIPIEGVFRMDGHVLGQTSGQEYRAKPGEPIPDEYKEVSAVMVKVRTPQAGFQLYNEYNRRGTVATFAYPIASSMADLFGKIGWIAGVLQLLAWLVAIVAAASILASLTNSMNERRREFAILRALGARRKQVFGAIILEAGAIAFLGTVFGYLVGFGIVAGAAAVIRGQTGVVLDVFAFNDVHWIAPLAMLGLGIVAGVIPAIKAYRTDVASNLAPLS